MKVRIVVDYAPRYRRGHLVDFVPPVTGIHLAALTPPEHEVELFHEQVRPVPVDDTPIWWRCVDVPFLSILTPFRGTALYRQHLANGRILGERDWPHYNGYNVVFQPARMSPDELLQGRIARCGGAPLDRGGWPSGWSLPRAG